MSIVSTREGREGCGERNLHLSGQLDNYRVQGPQYYRVWACCSEPFSVESMAKQSRVQPCLARVTSPPLVAAAFPTQGVAGTRGSKLPENLGLAGRPP
jgi:hypothetical protein